MPEPNKIRSVRFAENVESVFRLAEFDHVIIDVALKSLRGVNDRLTKAGFNNPSFSVDKAIKSLTDIRTNDSLRPHYEEMFNQCLVLLVAYFASTLEDLFKDNLPAFLPLIQKQSVLAEELRISMGEIKETGFDVSGQIGEWIVRKKDISFQDMQSIKRAFEDYFGVDVERNNHVNNIIVAQAGRHVIVHRAGKVDGRFLKQVSDAMPRDIMADLSGIERIQFDTREIRAVGESMKAFITRIVGEIDGTLGG